MKHRIKFSLGVRTSNGTTGQACYELIAGLKPIYVEEIEIILGAATASQFGLGRPAAKGITPTSPVALLCDDGSGQEALAKVAVAWGTGPTIPAKFFRRTHLAAAIGATQKWTFSHGLFVPAGGTLILWNLSATSVADVNVIATQNQ